VTKPRAVYIYEACPAYACFCLGWPLSPIERWFCPAHLPAGYWGGGSMTIRSLAQARSVLKDGHTFALGAAFTGAPILSWSVAADGEAVSRAVVRKLALAGEIVPIATDICGEPMQYARAS
jgi:hypothetical protein